jgi:hypothetical protein
MHGNSHEYGLTPSRIYSKSNTLSNIKLLYYCTGQNINLIYMKKAGINRKGKKTRRKNASTICREAQTHF